MQTNRKLILALLLLKQITISFGSLIVLNKVDFQFDRNERICLVGRNGAGKSTLMKLIAGDIREDSGRVLGEYLKISRMEQEVSTSTTGKVFDVVAKGLGDIGSLLIEYNYIIDQLEVDHSEKMLIKLEKVQHKLEAINGWSVKQRVEAINSRLSLNSNAEFLHLSNGMKRRVLLAQALIEDPDILLLDEPTNHLDITSITWLEEFLKSYVGTVLFITHDRTFLQAVATRIVQLDRGNITSYPGDYQNFLIHRKKTLDEEEQKNTSFDKKLSQEEAWMRKGIRARRARNEGRVKALEALRHKRSQRIEHPGNVKMQIQDAYSSGNIVLEAKAISYNYDDQVLFDNFSTVIRRGDRIGVIGKNGCGKSTLLSILLGKLKPKSGEVKQGTNLVIAYFDQLRKQLNDNDSVINNVGQGTNFVEINGIRKHIMAYLQDFLFTSERVHTPIKALSGGERNRLLLAKLFMKPANLLFLDEPTNDLDVETLDLLEDLLIKYKGTLLLVSHDRALLNNVSTSSIVFDDDGKVREYIGGYDDWLHRKIKDKKDKYRKKPIVLKHDIKLNNIKLSSTYKKGSDLESLLSRIGKLEQKQDKLYTMINNSGVYKRNANKVTAVKNKLISLRQEIENTYEHWKMLENNTKTS